MYCPHCGASAPDNAKFCTRCGRPLAAPQAAPPVVPTPPEQPQPPKKRPPLRALAAVLAVLMVALGVVIALLVIRHNGTQDYDGCMALAARYLEELDFEQAEAMYLEAIQLDPSQVDAYRALAGLYIEQERFEDALDILARGIAATGSGELQQMYDALTARLTPEEENGPAEGIEDPAVDSVDETNENNTASNLAISVDFEYIIDGGKEYAVITGLDEANGVVWTYQTDQYECAQLDRVSELGSRSGLFYYVEDRTVVALDISSGKKVWENASFGGSPSAFTFDDDGNLYICGYFGPDLFVMNENGETIHKVEAFSSDYYWPIEISYSEGMVAITYEGTPSGPEETLIIHLNDYSYTLSEHPLTWDE